MDPTTGRRGWIPMSTPPVPIRLTVPFGVGSVLWMPDRLQRQTAWRLHVELATQLGALPSGSIQEELRSPRFALAAWTQVVTSTRRVLQTAGPNVGRDPQSLGRIAIDVVQQGIQPFVERWHHRLARHEALRPRRMASLAHELMWPEYRNFFVALELRQQQLLLWVELLAEMAGAPVEQFPRGRNEPA